MENTNMSKSDDKLPRFGIRMKNVEWLPSARSQSFDESYETLVALRAKELDYKTKGFFNQRRQQNRNVCDSSYQRDPSLIDPECREKMCEWCYVLSDCGQFPCCREMVAVALSYLDRYLERRYCDRRSFKIAAVTSFYLATKVLSTAQLSIRSLVELGRGEYDDWDIREMEMTLLKILDWRLNPITPQSFIRQLLSIFCSEVSLSVSTLNQIYGRAIFFAELSVYDHTFVSKDRYSIAVACVLCSMEALDCEDNCDEGEVLRSMAASMCVDIDQRALDRAQGKLWYLYSCSAQNSNLDIFPLIYSEKHMLRIQIPKEITRPGRSPSTVRHNV